MAANLYAIKSIYYSIKAKHGYDGPPPPVMWLHFFQGTQYTWEGYKRVPMSREWGWRRLNDYRIRGVIVQRIPFHSWLSEWTSFWHNNVRHYGRWHFNASWNVLQHTLNICSSIDAWWDEAALNACPPHRDNFSHPQWHQGEWWLQNLLTDRWIQYSAMVEAGNAWYGHEMAGDTGHGLTGELAYGVTSYRRNNDDTAENYFSEDLGRIDRYQFRPDDPFTLSELSYRRISDDAIRRIRDNGSYRLESHPEAIRRYQGYSPAHAEVISSSDESDDSRDSD